MSDPDPSSPFPRAPIDRLVAPFERFLHVAAASGIALAMYSGRPGTTCSGSLL